MPVMNGIEFMKNLKARRDSGKLQEYARTHSVISTALSDGNYEFESLGFNN